MRGVPTERAAENKKFSWEFFFPPLYLHGGQPLSVGIFCAFRHNIKVFGVVIDGTFSAQRVVIRRTISGQKHCYRGHISGDFRCYQRHNFLQYVLLSTTQFPADFPTIAPSAVVIRRTFPRTTAPRRHCYPRHNSRFYRDFSAFFQKSSGCYPSHNSRWRWLRGRCCYHRHFLRHGLLSAAQFRKKPLAAFSGGCYPPHNFCRTRRGQGCYPQHSFDSGNFFVRRCYARHISEFRARCCYQRHNSLLFLWGCYSAHNSPKAPMSRRVLERTAHFKNPVLWVVIGGTILFSRKNPAAEFLQKKYFFALLHPAHGYFRHSFVVISGTIGLERAAHFCCNIRHSYTYFLNIYKYLIKISKRKNADFGRRKRNVSSVTIIDTCNTICYYTLIVL